MSQLFRPRTYVRNVRRSYADPLVARAGPHELLLGRASELKWDVVARAQVLGTGTRALAAWSDGIWFGRDKNQLVAVEITSRR